MTMDAIARMRVCLAMTRLLNTAAKAIHEPAEAPMKMRSRSAGSSLVRGAMKSTLSDQSLASIHVMASVQRTSVFKVSLCSSSPSEWCRCRIPIAYSTECQTGNSYFAALYIGCRKRVLWGCSGAAGLACTMTIPLRAIRRQSDSSYAE